MCQRIAPLLGNEKVTVKVKRETDEALEELADTIERRGDYLYPANTDYIPIRMPNTRKLRHISKEELAEARYRILKTCIGTTGEALCTETARVYGFMRMTDGVEAAMGEALGVLIESGKAVESEGKLRAV